jgi:hypothetical protein
MSRCLEGIARLKGLLFLVSGIGWFRGANVIVADWGWNSLTAVLAVFVPPIPVFVTPIYEGVFRGSSTFTLLFYGAFTALSLPFGWLEDRRQKAESAAS